MLPWAFDSCSSVGLCACGRGGYLLHVWYVHASHDVGPSPRTPPRCDRKCQGLVCFVLEIRGQKVRLALLGGIKMMAMRALVESRDGERGVHHVQGGSVWGRDV